MAKSNQEEPNGKSDKPALLQCKKWLEEEGYKSPRIVHHPTDIECWDKNGKKIYVEVKMTTSESAYFGAATLTEWVTVLDEKAELKFVVARQNPSKSEQTTSTQNKDDKKYDFYWVGTQEFYKISTVPPFKVNFNIKKGEFKEDKVKFEKRRPRKSTIVLNKELVKLLGDIYSLLKDKELTTELTKAVKKIKECSAEKK